MSNTLQVYLGLGGIALGTLLLAAIPTVATTILGCFLIGFAAAGIIVPSQTLVQQETPPELMGRVGSTLMSAIFSAQILGLVLSGVLAQYTSIRGVFALCTALLVALIVAGKLWMEPAAHPALS
jgi:DHA3 family macrolide efflux protein-like MFS transporter